MPGQFVQLAELLALPFRLGDAGGTLLLLDPGARRRALRRLPSLGLSGLRLALLPLAPLGLSGLRLALLPLAPLGLSGLRLALLPLAPLG
ncbi:MAG: hypothetical protein ICV73_18820, partial [Acetobacteraceae bacterium]|nr:hypothetical protein [Acetobacteraceae bacterium]